MTKATGILITFQNGDRHIITAPPGAQQQQYFISLTRWFDELAHDGEHEHDRFAKISIKRNYSFDPTSVRADQVWPDVVSYLQQYEVDADPERDAEDEEWEATAFELVPPPEPFNAVEARGFKDEPWTAACYPVVTFFTERDLRSGKLRIFDGVETVTTHGGSAWDAHRPTPECSQVPSAEPACPVAAEHLRWLAESRARREAKQAEDGDA